MKNKNIQGFTLIELMIVVAIIAILTLMGVGGYGSSMRKARDARRKSEIQALSQALTLYRMDWSYYPNPDEEYWNVETAFNCLAGTKCHGFLPYMGQKSALFDPESKNFALTSFQPATPGVKQPDIAYTYICGKGTGTSSNKCKSYLICAELESKNGGNFKLTGSSVMPARGSGTSNTDIDNIGSIVGKTSDGGVQYYCAKSS